MRLRLPWNHQDTADRLLQKPTPHVPPYSELHNVYVALCVLQLTARHKRHGETAVESPKCCLQARLVQNRVPHMPPNSYADLHMVWVYANLWFLRTLATLCEIAPGGGTVAGTPPAAEVIVPLRIRVLLVQDLPGHLVIVRTCVGEVLSTHVRAISIAACTAAFVWRWSALLAFAAARTFATSLLSLPLSGTANVDGDMPLLSDVLADSAEQPPPRQSHAVGRRLLPGLWA